MCKWDRCHNSYQVPKYRKRFECSWSGCIVVKYRVHVGILEFRSQRAAVHPLLFRCEAERLFASAGDKGIACAERIEIPLSASIFRTFFLRSLFIPGGPIAPIGELCPCADPYIAIRMYKERKNRELVGGSMRNGRPSLPPASLSRQSRRVTMNGRYYFIGDQAKSKIEKRTGRDERK